MPTAFKITNIPDPYAEIIRRFGVEGHCLGASEEESLWAPYGEYAAIRHMSFDVRSNWYGNVLWIKRPGITGTQKHHGCVLMLCLEGSCR